MTKSLEPKTAKLLTPKPMEAKGTNVYYYSWLRRDEGILQAPPKP